MRRERKTPLLAMASLLVYVTSAPAQSQTTGEPSLQTERAMSSSAHVTTINQAIDRIIARERDEMATIRQYQPLIETYIQYMKGDPQKSPVPIHDDYLLGQANLASGVVENTMVAGKHGGLDESNPLYHVIGFFKTEFVPEGFLQMIYIDTDSFDRQHYHFEYLRSEFLGDVKCAVFDVTPLPNSGRGRFQGRIWAENRDYTIIRFNGAYVPVRAVNGFNVHFDSWRVNVQPGLWVPAFVFGQELETKYVLGGHVRFLFQTRLWGYDLKNASRDTEFTELTVESQNVKDQATSEEDPAPLEADREWLHEAEINVLDRLQRTGFLAPPGQVDKVLETVAHNLEISNQLDIHPEIHCRVLLTGTLESFSIGHTIVLSRGLLDVLPDEASLATMLAQQLAQILITRRSLYDYGFDDATNLSTAEVMSHFSFQDDPVQIQQASERAVELLRKSPYKDKLGNAGLFLKQLDAESKSLSALINPHLGNRVFLVQQLMASAPPLQPDKVDQIAALPIGARLQLNPWNDRVALRNSKPVPLYTPQDKMPFQITPFMPVLTLYQHSEKAGAEGVVSGQAAPLQPR